MERAPPLTSHNRPGKRFAATLDSAPHKPNQINDKDLHAQDALPGASGRDLWQSDFAWTCATLQLCNTSGLFCGVCVSMHTLCVQGHRTPACFEVMQMIESGP